MANKADTQLVLTFDGQDDYVDFGKNDIGGVFAEGSSTFTTSGWINPHQLTQKASSYGTRNVFFARSSNRYSDNFEFGISDSGNLDVYIDEKVNKGIKTFGSGELTIGQWHFFAIVFDQGQLTVYLDNHVYSGSFKGSSLNKATSPLTLGATLHNSIYFTGQLTNISVWNYPCSPTEVQTQQHQTLVGNEQGLVAYWILNEGEGTIIQDKTGKGHDGKLYGKPHWDLVELPLMNEQSSIESNRQSETASSPPPSSAETPVSQEDSSTQETILAETSVSQENSSTQETALAETLDPISQSDVPVIIQPQEPAKTLTQEDLPETMNTKANPQYKVLAIDGGGIRGLIPALILAEIEKRTQKQIFSLFDLIAGTSSGGILALGLTKPRLNTELGDSEPVAQYSAEELVKLFVEYGAEIFYEPFFGKMLGQMQVVQPKYSAESREEIFRQYFGDILLENNLKEVFVTSYDIEQRIPIFFTNKLEKQQTESRKFRKLCGGFRLIDAALATSATPTYFPPHRIVSSHNTNGYYTLVDGGLVANNPANLAILEAQINRQEKTKILNREDILVVSLGTGSLMSVYSYNEVKNWGLLQWGRPLLNIVFDGGSEVVAGELERLFESNNPKTKTYYRFQTFLPSELEEMDNTKPDNIRELQVIAQRLIAEKSQEIDELCSHLLN